MLKNYITTALRNIYRYKLYTFINIISLAIGITGSFLIYLYLHHELSYDKHFQYADRIYRLSMEYNIGGQIDQYANVPRPVAPAFADEYPEVEAFARLVGFNRLDHAALIENPDGEKVNCQEIFYADSTFFDLFEQAFIQGNPKTALVAPNSIVLTESLAKSLFGHTNVFGKTVKIDNQDLMQVTGIIKDATHRSHLRYQALASWTTIDPSQNQAWLGRHVYTYILLKSNARVEQLEAKFPAFYNKYMAATFDQIGGTCKPIFQPLKSIHLHSNLTWEAYPNGDVTNIYIFRTIAIFLLLIACINYINLATARSAQRAKEIGLRKVVGSMRKSLIFQFAAESIIIALFAAMLSFLFSFLFLPVFNQLTGINFTFQDLLSAPILIGTLIISGIIGLLAGLYPAIYLSGISPLTSIRNEFSSARRGALLRKSLVVFQFAIAALLIVAVLTVFKQLDFAKNKDLGFNKENVLIITVKDAAILNQMEAIKTELLRHPDIIGAAASNNIPGAELNHTSVEVEQENGGDPIPAVFQFIECDYDFLDMMSIQLKEGRAFSRDFTGDIAQSVLVNEAAVKSANWQNPIGKKVFFGQDQEGNPIFSEVIGVTKDFHVGSMHKAIEPIVFFMPETGIGNKLFLRLNANNLRSTVQYIEKEWAKLNTAFPLEYVFLDNSFDQQYKADEKLFTLIGYFASITVCIACLGLWGLATFTAARRTKEISVRKVLGASMPRIFRMLAKDFLVLILIANILAFPLAYWLTNKWLESFAYRTSIGTFEFLLAILVTILIALLTISYQSMRVAKVNPAETLKNE